MHQVIGADAVAIADAVCVGRVLAREVVEAHLLRIGDVNGAVGAVTQLRADAAREAADRVDSAVRCGAPVGPLTGVPFTVKEDVALAGAATTFGVPALAGNVAAADAPPVRRLRTAGAIPLGHTNLPDLSIRFHTSSTLYGDTINPWDPARSPGGSSGGDAVAVATQMSVLGLGNDSGGSVRVPATFAGVCGLKPSTGRFAADHRIGNREPGLASQLFPVDGPLARSVADLRAAFSVLAGTDPADPRAVPAPLVGPAPGPPTKVVVVADPLRTGVDPAVRAAVDVAASVLSDAGYAVSEGVVPMLQEALESYRDLVFGEFRLAWPVLQRLLGNDGRRYIEFGLARTPEVDLARYVAATGSRLAVRRAWAAHQADHPLLLGPVYTQQPPTPSQDARSADDNEQIARAMALCTAGTFAGLPAVAVPTGCAGGLPQGVQVIGPAFREDLCLAAAQAIESACGRPVFDGGIPGLS